MPPPPPRKVQHVIGREIEIGSGIAANLLDQGKASPPIVTIPFRTLEQAPLRSRDPDGNHPFRPGIFVVGKFPPAGGVGQVAVELGVVCRLVGHCALMKGVVP